MTDDAVKKLRKKKLIEGRKPLFHISSSIASITDTQTEYIHVKGLEDDYCKKLIKDYLQQFGQARRADFEGLLFDKLSRLLSEQQKKNKVKNLLQAMRQDGIITSNGKTWELT